jgi:hypothetical protein
MQFLGLSGPFPVQKKKKTWVKETKKVGIVAACVAACRAHAEKSTHSGFVSFSLSRSVKLATDWLM